MANHPNRGPKGPASNPDPAQVKAARAATGLTQTKAAALVHSTIKAWQTWEDGTRRMPPGLWELFNIKTGWPTNKGQDMENKLNALLDQIIEGHPKLANDAHRVWLASIARGYRLMRRYGTTNGDSPGAGPGLDEWLAGNVLFAHASNQIREIVGNDETEITRRICAVEGKATA